MQMIYSLQYQQSTWGCRILLWCQGQLSFYYWICDCVICFPLLYSFLVWAKDLSTIFGEELLLYTSTTTYLLIQLCICKIQKLRRKKTSFQTLFTLIYNELVKAIKFLSSTFHKNMPNSHPSNPLLHTYYTPFWYIIFSSNSQLIKNIDLQII